MNSSLLVTGDVTARNFLNTSDRRLKCDIEDFTNPSELIKNLKPKKYRWKTSANNQDKIIGLIAQQVQKVKSSLVKQDRNGRLCIDYGQIQVVTIAAVQELYNNNLSHKNLQLNNEGKPLPAKLLDCNAFFFTRTEAISKLNKQVCILQEQVVALTKQLHGLELRNPCTLTCKSR